MQVGVGTVVSWSHVLLAVERKSRQTWTVMGMTPETDMILGLSELNLIAAVGYGTTVGHIDKVERVLKGLNGGDPSAESERTLGTGLGSKTNGVRVNGRIQP